MVTLADRALAPTGRELAVRAARVRLVLTDCDGVLTDGAVYYSADGEALRRFSVRDGMGVERLREAGIATAIVTREESSAIARRAEKLHLAHAFLGVRDKERQLPALLRQTGCALRELAYIGDDVNDLGIIAAIAAQGLTAAPADAVAEVSAAVHHRCLARGGHGAFREFAEWILSSRRRSP